MAAGGAQTVGTKIIEIDVRATSEALANIRAIADRTKGAETAITRMGRSVQDGFSGIAGVFSRLTTLVGAFYAGFTAVNIVKWVANE